MAIEECQAQFSQRRWNCPTVDNSHGGSIFGNILKKGKNKLTFTLIITITGISFKHVKVRSHCDSNYVLISVSLSSPSQLGIEPIWWWSRSNWWWHLCHCHRSPCEHLHTNQYNPFLTKKIEFPLPLSSHFNVKELRIHEKTMSFLIIICETYRDAVWRLVLIIFSQCSILLYILFSLTSYSVYNASNQLNRFWAAFTKKKRKWFPAGHTSPMILKDFIKELSPLSINIALR